MLEVKYISLPFGAHAGSVLIALDLITCLISPPSESIIYICEFALYVKTIANFLLSGDHAGALLFPLKFANSVLCPVASS